MDSTNIINEIKRLEFEDFLWVVFAIISIINIYGDYNEKEYLKTNNKTFENKSNKIFEFTLTIALLIYIYFFSRNYNAYKESTIEKRNLYTIKLLGSSLLIAGVLCLLYFQKNQTSFIGSPSL